MRRALSDHRAAQTICSSPDKLNLTLDDLVANLRLYAQLKNELGANGVDTQVNEVKALLREVIERLRALPDDPDPAAQEPDDLASIRDDFPPNDYWSAVPDPSSLRYKTIRRDAYTSTKMQGIPVDDDLQFTLLGLLILEESPARFTVDDVVRGWLKYLPFACTAEDVALSNIERGISPRHAGASGGQPPRARSCHVSEELPAALSEALDNPYYQWIGADIRCDPWGYVAPGRPELAAEMAYHDAYLTHRRNGISGAMYFADGPRYTSSPSMKRRFSSRYEEITSLSSPISRVTSA